MASASEQQVNISLRTPDEFLSGFLSIAFALSGRRADGDLDTFPEQEGCWYLVSVHGGAGRLTCELGCVLLSDGQAAAVSGESPLDVLFQGEGQLRVLCLKGSAAAKFLRREERQPARIYPEGGAILADVFEDLQKEEAGCGTVSPEAASAAAYRVLTRFYAAAAVQQDQEKLPQVVETALKMLQQDFAFLDGIGDLAQRLEVSQEYLTRTFRTHVGMTPGKYLNQVRLEHAKLLLRQGDHNVAFVADACGFANGNYFARVFRSMVGVSPSVYAKENAGENDLPHPMLDSIYVL